ncbi:MAG: endo-1,4-beta-xylanase precursor [Bacteroidetes bacterium]|nr:endo-1,4-beta-xylanase precursor [Bacteroidota bacterium]
MKTFIGKMLVIKAILVILIAFVQLAAYGQVAMRRPISPSQPMLLIHIDSWNYADPQKIIDLIPSDVRPYVVMNISLSINHDASTGAWKIVEYGYETAKSWLRTCAENGIWCMVQPASGGACHFSDTDLTVYKEFYENYPNFIGFNYAEQFWGFDDASDPRSVAWTTRIAHFVDLVNLADTYGGYLCVSWCGAYYGAGINPVAMLKKNSSFATVLQTKSDHFIMCEKFTSKYGFYDIESTCLGSYLSGYSGQYGIRFDQCGWSSGENSSGSTTADFPVPAGLAPVIEHSMLTGQTVFDGPELIWSQCIQNLSNGTTSDGYTTRKWSRYPQYDNITLDAFRKILDGTIRLMTRSEVIDRTKVVIIQDVTSGTDVQKYSAPETLFTGLYQTDSSGTLLENRTWFKKTGRYPAVPTVYALNGTDANSFSVQVNASAYSTRWPSTSAKTTEFNSLFTLEYTGDIYAARSENGWVVYNPYKTSTTATGNIPFKYNTCTGMDLSLSQYTTGIIKEVSNKVTIYLNNYDNTNTAFKTDILKINGCSSQPTYTITERGSHTASTVTTSYSGGVFTINVSHNGALDISVNCSGSATGRLTSYKTASLSAPSSPAPYLGPRQYEAENFDYKNISGNVTEGYNTGIANYTAMGYLKFGTSSSASIRDTINVPASGSYTIAIKYTTTGGSVSTIDLYVNGTKVATPAFAAQTSTSTWSTVSQSVTLNSGKNTVELKANATGSRQIYFDNIVVTPVNSGVGVWMEAECGTVGSLWSVLQSATGSSGQYIRIQDGNNSTSSVPGSDGYATYTFDIATAGTYNLWARVRAPSSNDDSFWLKMDNGSWNSWNGITYSTAWTWAFYKSFSLSEGSHTLIIAYREDGTDLDKLYIGTDVPTEYGESATNCTTKSAVAKDDNSLSDTESAKQPVVVSTDYYSITGAKIHNIQNMKGVFLVKKTMSDGIVKTTKILQK